jgi:hypothetical protein
MLNLYIFDLKQDAVYTFLKEKFSQIPNFINFFSKILKDLAYQNHFFNDHKTVILKKIHNLISRKQSNDEFLNTTAMVTNAPVKEKQNKFLPTDPSFRILGKLSEVVS